MTSDRPDFASAIRAESGSAGHLRIARRPNRLGAGGFVMTSDREFSRAISDVGDLAPVRLCCFQRHFGAMCPDGMVMCCLCFDRFDISDLAADMGDGFVTDICKKCAEAEGQPQ